MKKIGFDIHGVIDEHPEFFSGMANSLIQDGHEVHIITGASKTKDLTDRLAEWNIPHTHFYSILDDHIDEAEFFEDGTFHIDDKVWDSAKALYCKDNGIHLHIDDTPRYGKYMKYSCTHFLDWDNGRINMPTVARATIAGINGDCDNFPCQENCPQYILWRDKVRDAINGSEIADLAADRWAELTDNHLPKQMVDSLVDAIFEELV